MPSLNQSLIEQYSVDHINFLVVHLQNFINKKLDLNNLNNLKSFSNEKMFQQQLYKRYKNEKLTTSFNVIKSRIKIKICKIKKQLLLKLITKLIINSKI